jgi:hypothetical protein
MTQLLSKIWVRKSLKTLIWVSKSLTMTQGNPPKLWCHPYSAETDILLLKEVSDALIIVYPLRLIDMVGTSSILVVQMGNGLKAMLY